jgi:ADP-ribose pyrophosphatase YjhB (NUDIX family)
MNRLLYDTLVKVFGVKLISLGTPVIITNSKKQVLLGKRDSKSLYYPNFWGLPGGITNYGELLIDGAKREVKEELGVDIKIIKAGKKVYEHISSKVHGVGVAYHAKIIRGIPKPKHETSEIKWFNPSEVRKMKLAYNHKEILKGEGLI